MKQQSSTKTDKQTPKRLACRCTHWCSKRAGLITVHGFQISVPKARMGGVLAKFEEPAKVWPVVLRDFWFRNLNILNSSYMGFTVTTWMHHDEKWVCLRSCSYFSLWRCSCISVKWGSRKKSFDAMTWRLTNLKTYQPSSRNWRLQ